MEKLFFHTDIHSHVCPGIDDGARSSAFGADIVEGLVSLGIRNIVATPHVMEDVFPNTERIISYSFGRLKAEIERRGIEVNMAHSAEYRIDEFMMSQLETVGLNPLPGGYLLLENAWTQEPFGLDSTLFDIQNRTDYHIILAHPERYQYYHDARERYGELREKGVLFQLDLLSFAGHYGKACKSMAEWMLEHDLIDFLGSDAHNVGHVEEIRRFME